MKVSIVTVTYNSARYVRDAVQSVLSQSYLNIEYIVIDGASQDGTQEIVRSFEQSFQGRLHFISEPDSGIYDAMNKGLSKASGDVVGFLNSDDILASSNVVQSIVDAFQKSDADIVYGDLVYVDQEDLQKIIRYWRSGKVPKVRMRFGWHPPHPSFYVSKRKLKENGVFATKYRISADYEQMVRLIEKIRLKSEYLPLVFVCMRSGGVSNKSLRNIIRANLECIEAWKDNGLSASPLLIPLKLANKFLQKFYRIKLSVI